MRIAYDPEVDIITFYLADRDHWAFGKEVAPGVILAFDSKDAPVALEVHAAKDQYGEEFVKKYDIHAYRPLAEVAAQHGLATSSLRDMARKGRLKAKKQNGRWVTTPASVEDCVDQLTPSS